MPLLRLAILAPSATEQELALIRQAASLAIRCLNSDWSLTDNAQANLLLVWINSEKDVQAFKILQEKYTDKRLIVWASNELPVQTSWYLPYPKRNTVPTVLGIANLFSRVQAHFLPAENTPKPDAFVPEQCLLAIVLQALADGKARICLYDDCPPLYLLPNEQAFYLDGSLEQLIPMVLADRQAIRATEASDHDVLKTVSYVQFSSRLSQYMFLEEDSVFQDIKVKKYKRYAINELLWFSALLASRGRLPHGIGADETVLLKHLPEYLRLEYYGKDYKPLADRLVGNAVNLTEMPDGTPCSWFEACAFYNACAALSLLESGETALRSVLVKHHAREQLAQIFAPVAQQNKGRIKIVIGGSVGSGKTAAIGTLSDFSPISTETRPSDTVTRKKSTTTVAMDYGEMRFHDNLKIFLYGTPGQKRFDFMSQLLFDNAWGAVLLIDNREDDPFAELAYYLDMVKDFRHKIHLAIGITHYDLCATPSIKDYADYLGQNDLSYPVMSADARDISSLTHVLGSLTHQPALALAS